MNPLAILNAVAQLVGVAATLVPELEKDFAGIKTGLSTTDPAAAQAQIEALHAQSKALTAKLDSLRTTAAG